MADFSFVLLYVSNPPASADFYAGLLGKPIVETSPTFAMVPLRDGVMLGLWKGDGVMPAAGAVTGSSEIAFTAESADAVRAAFDAWKARGVKIAQEPVAMDFGFTFTATDPDGHRLRVFAPGA